MSNRDPTNAPGESGQTSHFKRLVRDNEGFAGADKSALLGRYIDWSSKLCVFFCKNQPGFYRKSDFHVRKLKSTRTDL